VDNFLNQHVLGTLTGSQLCIGALAILALIGAMVVLRVLLNLSGLLFRLGCGVLLLIAAAAAVYTILYNR
jgi:hypothetical protein